MNKSPEVMIVVTGDENTDVVAPAIDPTGSIDLLGLKVATANRLKAEKIYDITQLRALSKKELQSLDLVGQSDYINILECLMDHGLKLKS